MAWEDILAGISGGLQGGLSGYEFIKDMEERQRKEQDRAARESEQRAQQKRQEIVSMLSALGPGSTIQPETAQQARGSGLGELVEWTPGRMASESVAGTQLPPLAEGFRIRGDNREAAENEAIDDAVAKQRKDAEVAAAIEGLPDPYLRQSADLQRRTGLNIPASSLIPLDERTRRAAEESAARQAAELEEYEAKKKIDRRYDKPTGTDDPIERVETVDEQGNPVTRFLPRSQTVGKDFKKPKLGPRPSIGQERTALGFFNRAQQAHQDMLAVEDEIAKMGLSGQTWTKLAPNFLQTPIMQKYNQAKKVLTEARLRKESGAAIAASEYDKDEQMGAVQPGDFDPSVIDQKRRYRENVLDGLQLQSGSAFDEFYGEGESNRYRDERLKRAGGNNQAPQVPSEYQIGQRVKLKNGQAVTITKINPDGTFEYR